MRNLGSQKSQKGLKKERLAKVRESLLKMIREEFPKSFRLPRILNIRALKPDFALSAGQFASIRALGALEAPAIYVYGGVGAKIADALIEVKMRDSKFQELSLSDGGYPMGRFGHSMHRVGQHKLLIYGGQISQPEIDEEMTESKLYDQIGCVIFDREKLTLRSVDENIFRPPAARKYHASCVIGKSYLVVFGGVNFQGEYSRMEGKYVFLSDLWVLDIVRGRWYSLPLAERTRKVFGKGIAYHKLVTTWSYGTQSGKCLRGKNFAAIKTLSIIFLSKYFLKLFFIFI